MTRWRLAARPVVLFGAIFVVALVALLPLRLILGAFDLDRTRIAAREATGSVWWGALREVRAGGFALGDLDAGLSPWPLFVGRARVDLAGGSTATQPLRGAISVSRHAVGMDDLTARLPGGSVFAPLPVSTLDLADVSVRYVDGLCEQAEGRVMATLGGDFGGISLGQGLSGTARCEAGALLLPLASQSGAESVALRISRNGRFRADVTVRPTDPAAAQKLALSGFRPSARGYLLTVDGTF